MQNIFLSVVPAEELMFPETFGKPYFSRPEGPFCHLSCGNVLFSSEHMELPNSEERTV